MGVVNAETRSPVSIALEHAVRRWNAETENASRLSHRENGILAVIATILGLGFFKAGDLGTRHLHSLFFLLGLFVVLTLVLLMLALRSVLWIPQSKEGKEGGRVTSTTAGEGAEDDQPRIYASEHLAWPRIPELHPTNLEAASEAYEIAYKRVTKAANSLSARNIKRKERIELGQRFLFLAALSAAVSIILYPLLGSSPKPISTTEVPREGGQTPADTR